MPIDQKVIEAARYFDNASEPEIKERARRVLLAQADCVGDGMTRAALKAAYGRDDYPNGSATFVNMRAAIADALRFEAKK